MTDTNENLKRKESAPTMHTASLARVPYLEQLQLANPNLRIAYTYIARMRYDSLASSTMDRLGGVGANAAERLEL